MSSNAKLFTDKSIHVQISWWQTCWRNSS